LDQYSSSDGTVTLFDCTFADNRAWTASASGILLGTVRFTRCTFTGNTGYGFSPGRHGSVYVNNCTLAGNDGVAIRCFAVSNLGSVILNNSIIAFNTGGPVVAGEDPGGHTRLSCCNIYGNEGGDWIGYIANQLGINGNISEDPMFCDAPNGDLTLHADSPCAPENSPTGCGLIGAWPVGCGVTAISGEVAALPWAWLRVYPNPVHTGSVVEWLTSDATSLNLYDPKGRLVLAREMDGGSSGLQQVRWGDLAGNRRLSPGIYFLELGRSSGQRRAARVIVIR
jgi:hypothetical protein